MEYTYDSLSNYTQNIHAVPTAGYPAWRYTAATYKESVYICGGNPLRFVDPSGHEHIVSDYIYTYKVYDYAIVNVSKNEMVPIGWVIPNPYVVIYEEELFIVGDKEQELQITLKKHKFTNINITVYET